MKKLTRAERYKRNYRIIKNEYQDSTLAKKYQTYSDESIYRELGIRITPRSKTPELKKVPKKRRSYYKRKLEKYRYARLQKLSVEQSRQASTKGYAKKRIGIWGEYYESLSWEYSEDNVKRRQKIWANFSKNKGMLRQHDVSGKKPKGLKDYEYVGRKNVRESKIFPPDVEERAIQRNREASHYVEGERISMDFDDYDAYGFAWEYYAYTEFSEKIADRIVEPVAFGVESYRDTRRIIKAVR